MKPGDRLGPYEILAPLGSGGMGEVYVARDSRLDRKVALKRVTGQLSGDAQALRSFRREAVALAALNHPNIAIVHGIEEQPDGTTVLVMELVDGETLAARLAERRLGVEESLQIGAQIAEALEVAHEHGIVHRDVKPGNVMIGARGLVKVLDFGLALRTGDDSTHIAAAPAVGSEADTMAIAIETDPLAGMTVGSPGYMSPEQILAQPADARSDVFAFSCVLYECLAGRPAFAGETAQEILRHTLTAPVNLDLLPASLPGRIRALIGRSLEKDPAARPADMRAVRLEIEEALGIRRAAALREGAGYTTPNNLSPEASSFVGREAVLQECERLLEGARLLTLLGMGGTGKTRVARRLAQRALGRQSDGVWFLNLAPVAEDAHVPDVAAAALGVQDEPGRTSLEALVSHVRDRKMLFVLDNCEQVLAGARALVTAILTRCSQARVITTSREPLEAPGETVFVLPTLALPAGTAGLDDLLQVESVRLFVDRARDSQPEFSLDTENAAGVVDICRRLDGIPLALELAAARVRMLGVSQIRARLGDRFKLLARPGGDQSARQQTVLATIQWSWEHLLPPEQDLLRRLAVFAGGWTLERAAQVVSDTGDEFEVLDVLTRLVERSFVVVERTGASAPRYRLLESVHHFALEKLRAHADETPMRERHLKAYEDLAERAQVEFMGPNVMQQIAELKPEEDNILAAFAWCAQAPDGARRGLALAVNICRFWTIPGRYGLARRVFEEALARDAGNPPSAERASALTRIAGTTLNLGDYEAGRRSLEESLAYWRTADSPTGLAAALGGLSVVAMTQARFEDARGYCEESFALYDKAGNLRGAGMALHNLATVDFALAGPDHGRANYERALALFRKVGDTNTQALCLSSLSTACLRCGDVPAAHRFLGESFHCLAQLESPREEVLALEAMAELRLAEGHPADAARFAGAAQAGRIALQLAPMHPEHIDLERLLTRIRAALGSEAFDRAQAAGRALTLPDAVAEARKILASS